MRSSRVRTVTVYALVGAVLGCALGWLLRPSDAELRDQARRLVPAGFSIVDVVREPTDLLLAQREAVVVEARGKANPSDTTILGGVPLTVESGQVRAPTGGYYAAAVTA